MPDWIGRFLVFLRTIVGSLVVILLYILRWFNSTVLGFLVLSIALYFNATKLGLSEPLAPVELVDWFVDLDGGYKMALGSSLLTITGFLIAFQAATRNWRDQIAASVALNAASEIQSFFSEATSKLISAKIFVDLLLSSAEEVSTGTVQSEIDFSIDYVFEQLPKFLAVRERLREMSIEVHGLQSQHVQSLVPRWGASKELNVATESLGAILDETWFTVPYVQSGQTDATPRFLSAIDNTRCNRFVESYDEHFERICATSGMVVGKLQKSIVEFNLSFLYHFLKALPALPELLKHRKPKI